MTPTVPTFFSRISILLLLSLVSLLGAAQIVINEVSVAEFNNGPGDDRFEIYNAGGATVDLDGYYLSDELLDPTKFQITGSYPIAPGGFLVVTADNGNVSGGAPINTNFKINQSRQEYAVLADPTGTIVDVFWMENPNQMGHSWGRATDGGGPWMVNIVPSIGGPNGGQMHTSYADTPVSDTPSGAHAGPISVTLSDPSGTPGSTIRYTLDGSIPNVFSTTYTGPIAVSATTVITARNFPTDPDLGESFLLIDTYIIGAGHTVPIVAVTGPELLTLLGGNQMEPIGNLEYFGADGQLKDEAFGEFNEHGNDSWAYPQRGFDYIARDQFGYNDEIHHQIFANKTRPSFKRLILKAAANDNYPFSIPPGGGAHVIDGYIHSISQKGELRMDERTHQPCVVYVNGQYWGVYDVREKVDDFDFTEYYYDQGEGDVQFLKTWGNTWSDLPNFAPGIDPQIAADWNDIRTFITTQDMTDDANYQYVKSQYNTGSLIDYFVLNSYVVTTDWLNWNTGWWRGMNPDGSKRKWRYILWDNDASFGQYINFTGIPDDTPQADPCNPENIGDPGGQGHVPILNALMNNEEFYNDYVSRFVDLSQTIFSCESMNQHMDSLIGIIEPEMQAQCDRWGGNVPDWLNNVQVIRDFIDARCAALNNGLVDCYTVDGPYPVTVRVMPPGAGWVEFNSIELQDGDLPWTGEYFGGLNVELKAHGYGINQFSNWTSNNHMITDILNDTTDFEFMVGDTITAWFVSETHEVMLDVEPAGAGTIDFFGTNYANLPTIVDAPELIDLDIETTPSGNFFVFDRWESLNNPFTPDDLSNPATINVSTTDTIIAVYNELDNYNLTLDVFPEEGGTASFEGFTPLSYPYNTGQLLGGDQYMIDAVSNPNWNFVEWASVNTLSDPADVAANGLTLDQNETLVARFEEDENYTLTVKVVPTGTGAVSLNGREIENYPYTEKFYEPDLTVGLEAMENDFFDFVEWSANNNAIQPDSKEMQVSISLSANDTVTAHFMREIYGFYIPTAFSPNGDGRNDIFKVEGHAVNSDFYSLEIFDRNGNQMFYSEDFDEGWVGPARRESEYYAPDNVYNYRLKVRSVFDNKTEVIFGEFVVLR